MLLPPPAPSAARRPALALVSLDRHGDDRNGSGAAADVAQKSRFFRDARVEAMQRRVDAVHSQPEDPYTIFRLPSAVRERHPDLYEPKVVSVGPYYHGRAGLGAAEQHKWRLLRDFLLQGKNDKGGDQLGACLRAASGLEADARRCYAEGFDAMGADDFAEMLVLDGCFLRKGESQLAVPGGAKWAWQHMYHDVLLLENHIPFFVLEKLHALAFPGQDGGPDHEALIDIFCKALAGDLPSSRPIQPWSGKTIHHLLHLHYECVVVARKQTYAGRLAGEAAN